MVDRRALLGLIAGLAGLALGTGAVVVHLPVLAVAAAGCALLAGTASVVLLQRLQEAERQCVGAAALSKLLDLPQPAREETPGLMDLESGLPDRRFFELAVEGRVAAARRHLWPVTVVLFEATFTSGRDGVPTAKCVRDLAGLIRATLRESDIACRIGPRSFGVVLEDTSEEGGVWTAERLQAATSHHKALVSRLAAGVASYPTHGLLSDDVLGRAQAALTRACASAQGHGLGQVEVAQADMA